MLSSELRCEWPDCKRSADVRDKGHVYCSEHALHKLRQERGVRRKTK
jgi:hypothetical protein